MHGNGSFWVCRRDRQRHDRMEPAIRWETDVLMFGQLC
jgi:hypothetical protein